jgi:hypothetical protein
MSEARDDEQRDSYGPVAPPTGGDPVAHLFLTPDMQRTVATPDGPAAVGWVRNVSDRYLREVSDGAVARHDAHGGRVDAREDALRTAAGDERYWRHEGRRPADLDRVERIRRDRGEQQR